MADQLPNIEGDNGRFHQAQPIVAYDNAGLPTGGVLSQGNSTQALLGADETFTGAWEVNSASHMAINVLADVGGQVIIDLAIVKEGADVTALTDSDVLVTKSLPQTIYAGDGYFRPVVKAAGRATRVRYINGSSGQSSFALATAYGENLFPPSVSEKNELLVTNLAAIRSKFAAFGLSDISSTQYAILVDLSDTTNWPHNETGDIVLTGSNITVDRANNSVGVVQIGVITEIDGTEATIHYAQGVSFSQSTETSIVRDRALYPNTISLKVESGVATGIASNFIETTTAVNTGVSLASAGRAAGSPLTVTPAVGDVIVKFGRTSGGNFSPSASISYYSER
jgi:hypothetical protein